MHAAPLKRRTTPRYPTKLEVLRDPKLLEHLPRNWAAHPELAVASWLLLRLLAPSECSAENAAFPTCPAVSPRPNATIAAPVTAPEDTKQYIVLGMPAPPVYLSEDEAWTVIEDELQHAHIALPDQLVPLEDLLISRRVLSYSKDGDRWVRKVTERPGTAKPFKADRGNLKRRLAVEFVSRDRYAEEGGLTSEAGVPRFDFQEAAASLSTKAGAEAKSPVYFGVLYDPATKSRAESHRLLRQQVREFIAWLQAQGAI
ncbi:MAG TPA: hypothetical protein VK163_03645 [Opitutaceae bacterium]|nr:hypothetical protein [Opitutaceae bacterium]